MGATNNNLAELFKAVEFRYRPVSIKLDVSQFMENLTGLLKNIPLPEKKVDKDSSIAAVANTSNDTQPPVDTSTNDNATSTAPTEIKFSIKINYDSNEIKTNPESGGFIGSYVDPITYNTSYIYSFNIDNNDDTFTISSYNESLKVDTILFGTSTQEHKTLIKNTINVVYNPTTTRNNLTIQFLHVK